MADRKERRDRVIEFTEEHKIIKTKYSISDAQKLDLHLESPDGETRNQIRCALSNLKGVVTNCKVITKADIGSDHRLVRIKLRMDKRLARLKP